MPEDRKGTSNTVEGPKDECGDENILETRRPMPVSGMVIRSDESKAAGDSFKPGNQKK